MWNMAGILDRVREERGNNYFSIQQKHEVDFENTNFGRFQGKEVENRNRS